MSAVRKAVKFSVLLMGSITAAAVIMLLLYSIPTDRAVAHVKESYSLYKGSNRTNIWTGTTTSGALSNFTDSIMINTAVFRSDHSILARAMMNEKAIYPDTDMTENFIRYLEGEEGYTAEEYSRYWHGYLLYLIPCLQFFNVGETKLLMMYLQFFLLSWLMIELAKIGKDIAAAFLIVALFINPVTTILTFQDADIYCIMLAFSIFILKANKTLYEKNLYYLVFATDGIITAFIDFLTYPMVALGVPLIMALMLDTGNVRSKFRLMIESCFYWAAGYVGMWGGKWIVCALTAGQYTLVDAFQHVLYRAVGDASVEGVSDISYVNTLDRIFRSMDDGPSRLLFIIAVILIVIIALSNRKSLTFSTGKFINCLPILVVSLSPFAWFFVIRNHSAVHPWLEYRQLSITIWGILVIAIKLLGPDKKPAHT